MAITTANQPKPISHTKDILLLFSVPLGIAVIALLFAYVPSLLARPNYSFIYSYCTDYNCGDSYSLDASGNITHTPYPDTVPSIGYSYSHLALYDAQTGSSKMLTFKEAQSYSILNSSKSPDGFTLIHETGDGGFLFWGDYHDGWQLKKGIQHKAVHLNGVDNASYGSNISFIGWVRK
jgi:hypothetical protein